MTTQQDAADAAAYHDLTEARPLSEYHDGMGDVLWWCLEEVRASNGELRGHRWAGEPPYVGSPLDKGFDIVIRPSVSLHIATGDSEVGDDPSIDDMLTTDEHRFFVGGWPGYHTHFTPIAMPKVPK